MASPCKPMPVVACPDSLRGALVLLAEDNEINQQIAIEFLAEAGVTVDVAVNGRQAVAMVLDSRRGPYDAVLMDVQMPEMDGIEATRRIRLSRPAADLPIIAMTAHAMEQERRRCLDAGMDDHISKPIDPTLLVQTLARLVVAKPGRAGAPVAAVGITAGLPWPPARVDAPAAAVPRPQVSPAVPELPDSLPPFDLQEAVARMSGMRSLVARTLIGFHRSFADAATQIDESLATARFDDLARLAHTLKGVAATLDAADLAGAAEALEYALLGANGVRPVDIDGLVETVKGALAPALAAAAGFAAGVPAAPPVASTVVGSGSGAAGDLGVVGDLIAAVRALVVKHSPKARTAAVALRDALGSSPASRPAFDLLDRIDRYDYRGAQAALERIEQQVGGGRGDE